MRANVNGLVKSLSAQPTSIQCVSHRPGGTGHAALGAVTQTTPALIRLFQLAAELTHGHQIETVPTWQWPQCRFAFVVVIQPPQ